jgi:hypothetical protein
LDFGPHLKFLKLAKQSKYWRKNLVELGPFLSFVRPMSSTLFYLRENSKHYPGIEPSTFGVAVGDTIWAAIFEISLVQNPRKCKKQNEKIFLAAILDL